MDNCLICKSIGKYPLCRKCARNPFSVERARQILAIMNELKVLRKTYNSGYAEIKNLNTPIFWDKLLLTGVNLEDQDGMTKDRIKTAFKFLPKSTRKILDIGAGNGFIEELISKNKNIKIFGNDISSAAIKNLKNKFKGQFLKESIYNMKYKKKYFDAIFILEVLEHIPPRKVFYILGKVKEFLKKKSSFVLSIPTNEGLDKKKDNLSGHVRMYTENLIRAELKISGFKVVKLKTFYAFKNLYGLKKVSAKILRNKWQPNNIVILGKPL